MKNCFSEVKSFWVEGENRILIDAWKTGNPNEEGRVVAEVQRSDEGHVSINYRSEVAKYDHRIQQAIWDAIAQLQTIPARHQSLSCF